MSHLKNQIQYIWIVGYILGVVLLFFYSFTQVDLSLTISRASWVQSLEKGFQYIGYFNRPLSTYLFIGIVLFFYLFYIQILQTYKQISEKKLWVLIVFSAIILGIAYNAFSYDLFNYIFDAKIFTHYHQNPYEHKALDYAAVSEPMLSFMRWTHRTYPYGPVWLGLTIPLSYIGLNYFLVTFFLFKALMVSAFLGVVWFIKKIADISSDVDQRRVVLFFALNPFVLIESIVSGHVDIVMMFFLMGGVYCLVKKKYFFSFVWLVLFYGIKFASVAYPIWIHLVVLSAFGIGLFIFSNIQKRVSWESWFIVFGLGMIIPVVLASLRTNFQPWYLLSLYPFFAIVSHKKFVRIPFIALSFLILFSYVPYLYTGNWDPPIPFILLLITGISITLTVILSILFYIFDKKNE